MSLTTTTGFRTLSSRLFAKSFFFLAGRPGDLTLTLSSSQTHFLRFYRYRPPPAPKFTFPYTPARSYCSPPSPAPNSNSLTPRKREIQTKMGKKSKGPSTPPSSSLLLPTPPTSAPIIDTHTHLASTFAAFQTRYASRGSDVHDLPSLGKPIDTVFDFARVMYEGRNVEAIVDVWCEHAQIESMLWKEYADAALETPSRWGEMGYYFVIGIHPHEAKSYTPSIHTLLTSAASHPLCVGLGEMGLDYHYTLSPPPIQQSVFRAQLSLAVQLNKPLTIHTREAEEDTERILKELVPREHRIHVHCFTDSPGFARRLVEWFPNLYIGVTGVVTYTTNANTAQVIRDLVNDPPLTNPPLDPLSPSSPSSQDPSPSQDPSSLSQDPSPSNPPEKTPTPSPLRILLETDAPYMVPSSIYSSIYDALPALKGKRFPICHSGMVPWTAGFVAGVLSAPSVKEGEEGEVGEGEGEEKGEKREKEGKEKAGETREEWTPDRVMLVARENARRVYGV